MTPLQFSFSPSLFEGKNFPTYEHALKGGGLDGLGFLPGQSQPTETVFNFAKTRRDAASAGYKSIPNDQPQMDDYALGPKKIEADESRTRKSYVNPYSAGAPFS